MCNMPDFDVVSETQTSIVYSSPSVAVVVPTTVDDTLQTAQQAGQMHTDTPDNTVRLEPLRDSPRSHGDRASLLAVLIDDIGRIEYRHGDVVRDSPGDARIPVSVAVSGTAALACYLAVHGLDNSTIADLLGVGDRTVSQYISDYRTGDR
jgi:hypothetical protein